MLLLSVCSGSWELGRHDLRSVGGLLCVGRLDSPWEGCEHASSQPNNPRP